MARKIITNQGNGSVAITREIVANNDGKGIIGVTRKITRKINTRRKTGC